VICNEDHRFLVGEQARLIEQTFDTILLEPVGRNTAPALTAAALCAVAGGEDPLLLAMPADQLVRDTAAFRDAVRLGIEQASSGRLVTFGVLPTAPETGYGYIQLGAPVPEAVEGVHHIAAVREKPQAEYCGWKVEVELRDGDTHLVLEVGDADGRWQIFFKNDLNVGADFDVAELTSYERWVTTYDTLNNDRLSAQRESSRHFPRRPLISVLVPVYNTPQKWLAKASASVGEQTYSNWELCLADDASTAPHIRPLLEKYAAADPRIKVCFRPKNGHISAASNSALELATGQVSSPIACGGRARGQARPARRVDRLRH
jgi:hypothetical protein